MWEGLGDRLFTLKPSRQGRLSNIIGRIEEKEGGRRMKEELKKRGFVEIEGYEIELSASGRTFFYNRDINAMVEERRFISVVSMGESSIIKEQLEKLLPDYKVERRKVGTFYEHCDLTINIQD